MARPTPLTGREEISSTEFQIFRPKCCFKSIFFLILVENNRPRGGRRDFTERTETLVGDDVDVGNIQMVRLGQDSKAPLYFSSEERRPGGFSYHHRVYNSDGSELQAEYPSHHIMNSERDQFSG